MKNPAVSGDIRRLYAQLAENSYNPSLLPLRLLDVWMFA